ncbi:MAG TPA: DUF4412 domain-containing protein [Hanamia sp.]|nr:DUF4412 domain-containing protein [Hanamia sp.]
MKTFYLIAAFAFLPFVLSLSEPGVSDHLGTNKNHPYKKDGKGVLLVYAGSFQSPQFSYDIGIHFEMNPSIGMSYQVTFERGDNVLSHIAIFYKFSKPNQSTIYNYLTRHSYISYNNGGEDGDPHAEVAGSETIDKYACTHLQNLDNDKDHTSKDDFWMSKSLPGFQSIVQVLNQLNSDAGSLVINGTIFKWGGLVKMTHYFEDKKTGATQNAVINLVEANPTMSFPASDFDVPSN